MNRRAIFTLLCTLATAAPLAAQTAPAANQVTPQPLPTVGSRIRVSAPTFTNGTLEVAASAGWQTGTVKSMQGPSLVLLTETEEVDIPFDVIRRVEISEGAMSSSDGWRRGARRGGLIGAALTTAVFAFSKVKEADSECDGCKTDNLSPTAGNIARGLALGVGAGAGIGVVLGSRERERWRRVDVTLLRPAAARP